MKKGLNKLTFREIGASKGRFLAILAITALGVGFFSGIKITTPAMIRTVDDFYREKNLYDLRLVSTLGWEKDAPEHFRTADGVKYAEGENALDAVYSAGDDEMVLKVHTLPEDVNALTLRDGRLPEKPGECVVDKTMLDNISVGDTLKLSADNTEDTKNTLLSDELTVVGKADSSMYINFSRGTTSMGNGTISGFIYVPDEEFDTDYYTDIYVKFNEDYEIYSDEYKDFIKEKESVWKSLSGDEARDRFDAIKADAMAEIEKGEKELKDGKAKGEKELSDAKEQLDSALLEIETGERRLEAARAELTTGEAQLTELFNLISLMPEDLPERSMMEIQYVEGLLSLEEGKKQYESGVRELSEGRSEYENGLSEYEEAKADFEKEIAEGEETLLEAREDLDAMDEPEVYVLGRDTNLAYMSFESDSGIVDQLAKVFPVFFILVASMICMTTMGRMVEEQRTDIGTLKALGYSKRDIMGKYMIYSGLAALIGCIVGYAAGITAFPMAIWTAYQMMYIPIQLHFIFNIPLAAGTWAVSMACILGTTYLSCRFELHESAASLMRPKAPKAGKRIFLEYIPAVWNRFGFMQKVSLRNIFRYKQRFFMMTLGIGGCMALLLAGYGIRDSVADFADIQYGEVVTADASVLYKPTSEGGIPRRLTDALEEKGMTYTDIHESGWELHTDDGDTKSIRLMGVSDISDLKDFFYVRDAKTKEDMPTPQKGEAYISVSIMDRMGLRPGDTVTLRNEDMDEMTVKISGVFKNFVYNYVLISDETLGSLGEHNTLYVNAGEGNTEKEVAALSEIKGVRSVTPFGELRKRMSDMMVSLNYVVVLVILCAAGLAFVVVYNLTNINITERLREIATIKVLGFYRKETYSYVLRENMLLTASGAFVGIFLGIALLKFAMHEIKVEMVFFEARLLPMSYVYSVILTFVFTLAVNFYMRRKLDHINMAESLKSVD